MLSFFPAARVKSYSSASRNGRHTLKVEVEYSDPYEMAYDMKQLDDALKAQKAETSPRSKRTLMLPAPEGSQ